MIDRFDSKGCAVFRLNMDYVSDIGNTILMAALLSLMCCEIKKTINYFDFALSDSDFITGFHFYQP